MDDEGNMLQGLQRMLRTRRNIWEMTFVTSGKEALQNLQLYENLIAFFNGYRHKNSSIK